MNTTRYEFNKQKALELWEQAYNLIKSDPYLIDYAKSSIERTLNIEFDEQIHPARFPEAISSIVLANEDETFFDFEIWKNNIIDQDKPVYYKSPFQNVQLIDSMYAYDAFNYSRKPNIGSVFDDQPILNRRRILGHSNRLNMTLKRMVNNNIIEEKEISNAIESIKSKINGILPGDFVLNNDGTFYIEKEVKIKLSNLATGSKLFTIIKMLLSRGEIQEDSLLILDEPEAHLHPEWQNIFAEIIVLLVKKLGVCILLTTHSPNLMLALETYMRKYKINDICNFYQTHHYEDNYFVDYECVNNDLDKIYYDFVKYFSDIKAEREMYILNDGE